MDVEILAQKVSLKGSLTVPALAQALVIVVLGKNDSLEEAVVNLPTAVLIIKLETEEMVEKLIAVTKWCCEDSRLKNFRLGYFGIGEGTQAVLSASAFWGTKIKAVVTAGGRPDLVGEVLDLLESPTLLMASEVDRTSIGLNRSACQKIGSIKKTEVFKSLSQAKELAVSWFNKYCQSY